MFVKSELKHIQLEIFTKSVLVERNQTRYTVKTRLH